MRLFTTRVLGRRASEAVSCTHMRLSTLCELHKQIVCHYSTYELRCKAGLLAC